MLRLDNIKVAAVERESSVTSYFIALRGSFVKSKKAEMKTRADKRAFVPGMLHDVSIAHLRLGLLDFITFM